MAVQDMSQRFIFEQMDIRGEYVSLERSYLETLEGHDYPEAVSKLLGQFLAAAVLLGGTIKFDGRLVLQARGDGQVSLMMSEFTSAGHVRGISKFPERPTAESFNELIGTGTLVITIDSSRGDPYQGIVSLEAHSLAECLQDYFRQSEQLGSWFMLAASEEKVSAVMLQQLPTQLQKDPILRVDQWEHVTILANTLSEKELLSLPLDAILNRLYNEEDVRLFEPRSVSYQCSCSRERTARALLAIGQEEVDSIVAEQGGVAISCEFCGTEYNFGPGEIELLFGRQDGSTH